MGVYILNLKKGSDYTFVTKYGNVFKGKSFLRMGFLRDENKDGTFHNLNIYEFMDCVICIEGDHCIKTSNTIIFVDHKTPF